MQLALEKTLQLVKEIKGVEHLRTSLQPGLDVAILGGNDFYSQRAQLEARGLPRTIKSLEEIPPFVHLGVTLDNAHKTGMGSSAALITSLVAALLVHLKGVDSSAIMEPLGEGRRLIHNLAQYVHCLAQGKVGSGFDVSAAIFGSHIYTRFDPSVISPLMDATVISILMGQDYIDESYRPLILLSCPYSVLIIHNGATKLSLSNFRLYVGFYWQTWMLEATPLRWQVKF